MSSRQLSPAATVFVILLVPLAVPALFVLLGPSADRARAQELGPKQAFVPPVRTSDSSANSGATARRAVNARTRTKDVATAAPAKPSGKMEFVPDSPAPRTNRATASARSAANAVARRQGQAHPAKVAATRSTPQAAPRLPAPSISAPPASPPTPASAVESIVAAASEPIEEPIEELMAEPKPVQVAKKPAPIVKTKELEAPSRELLEEPFEEPEMLVRSLPEPPAQFSERPEPPISDFELPIVRRPQEATPKIEENVEDVVVAEEEFPSAQMSRDVVQLYFEEEDTTEGDAAESMDLVEREAVEGQELADPVPLLKEQPKTFVESVPASEIRSVVAQEKPGAAKAVEPAVAPIDEAQTPSDAILAELKPVRSIEIRKAVEVPALAEMDNPQLREPVDQAGAMLRKRPPFKFWPVYRDPWVASRDSFAFHHNPLWFEDPNLERCGRGKGHFTSVSSFLQFNTNIAFLPYRMTAEPWHACVRTLPDCTVCQKFGCDAYLPPWSWRAAAVQAGCIVGFIYAIP